VKHRCTNSSSASSLPPLLLEEQSLDCCLSPLIYWALLEAELALSWRSLLSIAVSISVIYRVASVFDQLFFLSFADLGDWHLGIGGTRDGSVWWLAIVRLCIHPSDLNP
jgi:hypothetical protein